MNILITGVKEMVGIALMANLKNIQQNKNHTRLGITLDEIYGDDLDSILKMDEYCKKADFVFSLALQN